MTAFLNWIAENYIELIAVITGIWGVWLTTRQVIWCWPVGIINVLLYIYIFYSSKLYADFGLNIFYLVMTIYGWYNWLYGGKNHSHLDVGKAGTKLIIFYLIICTCSFFVIGFLLKKYTNASYPYWDTLLGVWGIIGTFMQAKKQIENWIVWIIIDLNWIVIYCYKELYLTAVLFFIFTILAIYGYIEWKKDLKTTQQSI